MNIDEFVNACLKTLGGKQSLNIEVKAIYYDEAGITLITLAANKGLSKQTIAYGRYSQKDVCNYIDNYITRTKKGFEIEANENKLVLYKKEDKKRKLFF